MSEIETIQASLVKLQGIEAIVVNDSNSCLAAKTAQRDIRNYMKDVHLKLDPFVESAKRNLSNAKDELNKWLAPAEALDLALSGKVKSYEQAERMRAEQERQREQELVRIEVERKAAIQRKIDEERIKLLKKAGELTAADAKAMKEQVAREQAEKLANVPIIQAQAVIPKVAGVPSRRNWKFRIVDAKKIPIEYLMPNEVKIGQDVRAWKRVGEVIPGVEAYED